MPAIPKPARDQGPRQPNDDTMSEPRRKTNERKGGKGRAVHDIGGLPDKRPIDRTEHEPTLHEKRVDALMQLLSGPKRQIFKVDALRRVIESYAEQDYDSTGYYEKWMKAVRNLVLEQEVVGREELDARIDRVTRELEAEGRKVSHRRVP
jgi:Nitrile hydratase beta subunit